MGWRSRINEFLENEAPPRRDEPSRRPSSLDPDDIDDFEAAARTRQEAQASVLRPPYDPSEVEEPTVAPRRRKSARSTKALAAVLHKKDRFRLKVFRGHIEWARKQAFRAGIYEDEVDLWKL